ncbi:hypothetical protein ACOSP7_019707 [Xanthoceras sorbifolium]
MKVYVEAREREGKRRAAGSYWCGRIGQNYNKKKKKPFVFICTVLSNTSHTVDFQFFIPLPNLSVDLILRFVIILCCSVYNSFVLLLVILLYCSFVNCFLCS